MNSKQFAAGFGVVLVGGVAVGLSVGTLFKNNTASIRGAMEKPTQLMVAKMNDRPSIGPIMPGQLKPITTAQSSDGVQLLMVGPEGIQKQPNQAVVVFDRPMVSLTDLDAQREIAPISCGPYAQGSARWAGTSTAVWVPEAGQFPRSHSFTCSVPKGLTAVDGARVEQEVSFSFSTLAPAVSGMWPRPSSSSLHPEHGIYVRFNQPVDPEDVARNATLTGSDGRTVVLVGARAEGNESYIPDWWRADDENTAVLLSGPLAFDTQYTLELVGVSGSEGPLTMNKPHTTTLNTLPPAEIKKFEPDAADAAPYSTLSFEFATETAYAEVSKRLRISPEPPGGMELPEEGKSRYWMHGIRFEPMTSYTVTLEPGLKDVHGQPYGGGPRSWSFTTGHLPALLDVATGPYVFPANNPDTLPIRSRNLSDLYVSVDSISPEWVIENIQNGYNWSTGSGRRLTSGPIVDLSDELAVTDSIRLHEIDLSEGLEPDDDDLTTPRTGLMMVESWSSNIREYWNKENVVIHRTLLQKTNLGTTVKYGPEGASIWVTNLDDGAPVADASVYVFRTKELRWKGTTNGQGVAIAEGVVPDGWNAYKHPISVVVRSGEDMALTMSGNPHQLSTWDHGVYAQTPTKPGELRIHSYTDRGVYRRGETAHVALTARVADKQGLSIPSGALASWTCEDGSDNTVSTGESRLDAHGALAFDVELPEGAALGSGSCKIQVVSGVYSVRNYVTIPIKAYRAPTFRVDVATPEEMVAGQVLSGNGKGRYLFGAPMAGMDAQWNAFVVRTTPAPDGWSSYSFGPMSKANWWEEEHHPQERIASGEGVLDGAGQLPWSFDVPLTETPETRTVMVEVQVTDVSRQTIANRSQVLVHPASLYAGVKFGTGIGVAGTNTPIGFVTVTPEGKAVSGVDVDFKVVRRTWDSIRQKDMDGMWTWVNTINDVEIASERHRSAGEEVSFDWAPPEGGYYVVKAELRDDEGRLSVTERGLYVAGAGATWARDDGNKITLVPDKQTYEPGDTATILVQAPRPGLQALLTVEREGILSQRVIRLKTTADTIEIPLGDDAVPNVYVSCVAVEGAPPADSPEGTIPNWYMGYTQLDVSPSGRRLSVDITTDSSTYQPGQQVQATVEVKRNGKAVPNAHVVLYAVDYGVLSLTGYETPNAFGTHYAKRSLMVRTSDSRSRVLNRADFLSKGAAVGGGGGDDGPGTRSRFVTTPLWMPNLKTDQQGRVTVDFELPDNLTTFKLMAVVDEGTDAYGNGSNELQVAKPLMAQPALPRLMRVGDSAYAGIVVHNNRDTDRAVQVQATATNITLDDGTVTVDVPANSALEVPFLLRDPIAGDAAFRFEVTAEGDRDAVEVSIPVERPQPVEFVASMGTTTGTAEEAITLTDTMLDEVGGLHVQVSPTVLVGADSSLTYMLDYPFDCLEQTSSRLVAAVLAKELSTAAAVSRSDEEVRQAVLSNLGRLDEFSHPSGGLRFWPASYSSPHPVGTAYAMEAKAMAGQMPNPDTVRFLRSFLSGKWVPKWWSETTKRESQVRVALALSRVGLGERGFNNMLFDHYRSFSPTAQAELMEAIARTSGSRGSRVPRLMTQIEGQLHVEASTAVVKNDSPSSWNGQMSATAAALSAIMVAKPDHPLAGRLAKGLMHARRKGRWENTYTTSKALLALRDYTAVHETADATANVSVELNGDSLIKEALAQTPASTFLPMGSFKDGTLNITSDGGTVHYETRLSYGMKRMPPRDEGFTVVRTYRMIEGDGAQSGVTPGALVRVDLRVVTPIQRTDVVVHDPLPAGLEPIDTSFKTTAAIVTEDGSGRSGRGSMMASLGMGGGGNANQSWSSWVFNHRQLDDASLTLFADSMPAGVHTYTYVARATTPGVYTKPAAYAQEMYRPDVFGRTEQGTFVVGEALIASNED